MRKCKHCKRPFKPQYNTIQPACSVKCAIEYGRIQAQKKADKEIKKRKREFRKNDKSVQKQAAIRACNTYIRYRDRNDPCISCDKPANWQGQWAAGHYYTTGARSDIRFNEDNIHKQCNKDCNKGKSGNINSYRPRIIAKIGIDRFRALEKVTIRKYTAEDYRNIAIKYRQKLKELKAINGE